LTLYLLFEAFFASRRPVYDTFRQFLQSWTWPAKLKKNAEGLGEIFGPERMTSSRKAKHIKCSASECWCLLMPLYAFVTQVLLAIGTNNAECNVFLAMLDVIDIIVSTPKHRVEPAQLLAAVHKFLELFVHVWGSEWTTPKFHWLLHFPEFLAKMHGVFGDDDWGWLPNCFALERKHKLGKRYATERTNTTRMKSGGLLGEVLCQHMSDLHDAPRFKAGLVQGHKATKAVAHRIRSTLELSADTTVEVCRSSWHSNISYSSQGDFVLFRDHGTSILRAGKVQLHFEAGGIPASILELYENVSRHNNYLIWKHVTHEPAEWIETDNILDCVVYSKLPDGNIACILPVELR